MQIVCKTVIGHIYWNFLSWFSDELELYNSIEEDDACVLCGQSDDDPFEFGKKITIDDITVHHFCAVSLFTLWNLFRRISIWIWSFVGIRRSM